MNESIRSGGVAAGLGLAHGLADCASGWLAGGMGLQLGAGEAFSALIIYNALAFIGQLPAGLILDFWGKPQKGAALGLGLLAMALLTNGWSPWFGVGLAGIGSAFFHSGGGAMALRCTWGKALGPGFFAAPGVLGLALGGYFSAVGTFSPLPLILGLLGFGFWIFFQPIPSLKNQVDKKGTLLEPHDFVMGLLLLAIALRSAVWNVYSALYDGDQEILFWVAASAMAGKLAGGILGDWLGWRTWIWVSMGGSTILLTLGGQYLPFLLPGIFFLQAGTAVMFAALHQLLPWLPATASGLALGFAIAGGGIPMLLGYGLGPPGWIIGLGSGAAGMLAIWALTRFQKALPKYHPGITRTDSIGQKGNK